MNIFIKMTIQDNIINAAPLLVMQLLSVVLYGLCTDYGTEAIGTSTSSNSNTIDKYYPFFQPHKL